MPIEFAAPDELVFETFEGVSVASDEKDCVCLRQGANLIRFPIRLISEVAFALAEAEQGDR